MPPDVHSGPIAQGSEGNNLPLTASTSYGLVFFYPISNFQFLYRYLAELRLRCRVRIWALQTPTLILMQGYIK